VINDEAPQWRHDAAAEAPRSLQVYREPSIHLDGLASWVRSGATQFLASWLHWIYGCRQQNKGDDGEEAGDRRAGPAVQNTGQDFYSQLISVQQPIRSMRHHYLRAINWK
jgi:hypothetical protein